MSLKAAAAKDNDAKEEDKAADLESAEKDKAAEATTMKDNAITLNSNNDYSWLHGVDDAVARTTEPRALNLQRTTIPDPTDLDAAKDNDVAINAVEDDATSLHTAEDNATTLKAKKYAKEDGARRYYLSIYSVCFMC